MKPPPPGWPRLSPSLFCEDPKAHIPWLERAFGFETRIAVEEAGTVVHSELTYGDALVMVAGMVAAHDDDPIRATPKSLGGKNTQSLFLYVDDVVSHYERAKAEGAVIIRELAVYDHGPEYWADKTYGCVDPEGHRWWFSERCDTGLTLRGRRRSRCRRRSSVPRCARSRARRSCRGACRGRTAPGRCHAVRAILDCPGERLEREDVAGSFGTRTEMSPACDSRSRRAPASSVPANTMSPWTVCDRSRRTLPLRTCVSPFTVCVRRSSMSCASSVMSPLTVVSSAWPRRSSTSIPPFTAVDPDLGTGIDHGDVAVDGLEISTPWIAASR